VEVYKEIQAQQMNIVSISVTDALIGTWEERITPTLREQSNSQRFKTEYTGKHFILEKDQESELFIILHNEGFCNFQGHLLLFSLYVSLSVRPSIHPSVSLSIYGSTALCWILTAFSVV
jgi:hypothetical protein